MKFATLIQRCGRRCVRGNTASVAMSTNPIEPAEPYLKDEIVQAILPKATIEQPPISFHRPYPNRGDIDMNPPFKSWRRRLFTTTIPAAVMSGSAPAL